MRTGHLNDRESRTHVGRLGSRHSTAAVEGPVRRAPVAGRSELAIVARLRTSPYIQASAVRLVDCRAHPPYDGSEPSDTEQRIVQSARRSAPAEPPTYQLTSRRHESAHNEHAAASIGAHERMVNWGRPPFGRGFDMYSGRDDTAVQWGAHAS
jgi:hypothetical protein